MRSPLAFGDLKRRPPMLEFGDALLALAAVLIAAAFAIAFGRPPRARSRQRRAHA